MKDFWEITKRHLLSPILVAIGILAVVLAFLGEFRDVWFVSSVALLNTFLGIIQEARARSKLKKLELMNRPTARRLKNDGSEEAVSFNQLRIGDQVKLIIGDEIPADGIMVYSAGMEADESILTGESRAVRKKKNESVWASSSVVAGSGVMSVQLLGEETKTGKMSKKLKRYEAEVTPIQKAISRAVTYLTYGALGLAVLIAVSYLLTGREIVEIFKTITAGAVTVIPEGLLFASTIFLAYGSIRLAQANVLPQKLSAIEAMALMNVLCLDKTGTLTSEKITFEGLEVFDGRQKNLARGLAGIIAKDTSGGSRTGEAVHKVLGVPKDYQIIENLAFSSDKKFSGARVKIAGKTYSAVMGAPEYLVKYAPLSESQAQRLKDLTRAGKRVMLLVAFKDSDQPLTSLRAESAEPLALAVLSNKLRRGIKQTIRYLQKNKIEIKVISGDNLETVQYVAKQAGVNRSDRVITGEELAKLPAEDLENEILDKAIFARILPEQKEQIIEILQKYGKFVGMVGDGANDALAIKKADFGVAMFAGSAVARRVADIILLDNSFNSLPKGMELGNRIVQSITLIASLFLHKISYMVVLLLTTLVLGISYPFDPRHITFMNMFLVSLPTLMWTLFPPLPTYRISPKNFWRDILRGVLPLAVVTGVLVSIAYIYLDIIHPHDTDGVQTTIVLVATFFGIYLVFLVSKMFNVKNNKTAWLARTLYILAVLFVFLISFGVGFVRDFFDFTSPAWRNSLPLIALIISVLIFQWNIAKHSSQRLQQKWMD